MENTGINYILTLRTTQFLFVDVIFEPRISFNHGVIIKLNVYIFANGIIYNKGIFINLRDEDYEFPIYPVYANIGDFRFSFEPFDKVNGQYRLKWTKTIPYKK